MKKGVLKRFLIVLSILAVVIGVPLLLELDDKLFNGVGFVIALVTCCISMLALVFFLVVAWIINPDVFKEGIPEEKEEDI